MCDYSDFRKNSVSTKEVIDGLKNIQQRRELQALHPIAEKKEYVRMAKRYMSMQVALHTATSDYEPHDVVEPFVDRSEQGIYRMEDTFVISMLPHMNVALEEVQRDYDYYINPDLRAELIEQHEFTKEQQAQVLSESRTMFDVADYLAEIRHDAAVDCTLRGY